MFLCPLHGKIKQLQVRKLLSPTLNDGVCTFEMSAEKWKKKKFSFTVLYGISTGCVSKTLLGGTHYLYVYNNDSGAAESRTPAQ